jgi:nitric oxide reductase NorD protein
VASEDRSFLYDEWDVHASRYLPSWCRVHERPLVGGDPAFISDVRRRHAALARQVRRQFAMITAESWRRLRRERDGGELDLDEVVSYMVDRRRGIIDDEHLHIRQVRAAREVAAAFLLDMSASTSSDAVRAPPPPPPRVESNEIEYPWLAWDDDRPVVPPERTVLDLAKESLALMCDALQVIGDEHAIYGFSGAGRDNVEFYIAKELTEASSARTWARLAAMTSRQYTRMGPAIRHATTKLRGHAARTRFLVVVSDGYPQDNDYGPDRSDRSYGIADTAKALEEAERAGVSTFCVTVDPAGHDYLRDMCPDERYLVIDDVNSLPGELTKLYRSLVLSRR